MLTSYEINNYGLKRIWFLKSLNINISHELLPSLYPELICAKENPIYYNTIKATPLHLRGAFSHNSRVYQKGNTDNIGITLDIGTIQYLTGNSTSIITNKVINSDYLNIGDIGTIKEIIYEDKINEIITRNLIEYFKEKSKNGYWHVVKILKTYLEKCNEMSIGDFCNMHDCSIKYLERMFLKFVGISPVKASQLMKFGVAYRQLYMKRKMSEVAASFYYDQNHMIKAFRKYTGETPKLFISNSKYFKINNPPVSKNYYI